jgi:HEPN superfamily protein
MFPDLQLEVLGRFGAVELHFRASRSFRGESQQIAKGLVFVQTYAIHEYTVQTTVQLATNAIASHAHRYAELRPSLLAMFLDGELSSVRDCGLDNLWERRLELFERATSVRPITLAGNPMPADGTHFRHTHLELILKILGVSRALTLRRRHLYRIDEVVNHRNSIAHGRETAGEIGRRYSRSDISQIMQQMKSVSLRLISIVGEYCDDPEKHCR